MTDPLNRVRNALADRYGIERELGRGGMGPLMTAEEADERG